MAAGDVAARGRSSFSGKWSNEQPPERPARSTGSAGKGSRVSRVNRASRVVRDNRVSRDNRAARAVQLPASPSAGKPRNSRSIASARPPTICAAPSRIPPARFPPRRRPPARSYRPAGRLAAAGRRRPPQLDGPDRRTISGPAKAAGRSRPRVDRAENAARAAGATPCPPRTSTTWSTIAKVTDDLSHLTQQMRTAARNSRPRSRRLPASSAPPSTTWTRPTSTHACSAVPIGSAAAISPIPRSPASPTICKS